VGINGSGKTTFLKLLVGDLAAQSGKIIHSKGLKIGYFAQHQVESLDLTQTPVQAMLSRFKEYDQALSPIAQFSGGEKARLSLAIIVYQKPNLIILDEPTNHLDMDSRDALDEALQSFEGALIVVSHDRHLLAGIVDQYWWVHDGRVTLFHGDLDAYLQQRLTLLKQQKVEQQSIRPGEIEPSQNKKELRQQNAQLRKKIQDATRAQRKRLTILDAELEKNQQRLVEIHARLAQTELYEVEQAAELKQLLAEQTQVQQVLDDAEMEWLMLQEEVEAIEQSMQID